MVTMVQLIPLVVIVPLLVFWAYMFRDMTRNDALPSVAKQYWLFAFIFLSIFAAIVYYNAEYRNRN